MIMFHYKLLIIINSYKHFVTSDILDIIWKSSGYLKI